MMDTNLISFDPLLFKLPKGVITKGTSVRFFLKTEDQSDIKNVYLMLKDDNEENYNYCPMSKTQNGYEISYKFSKSGHFWYNFKVECSDFAVFVSKTFDNFSCVSSEKGEDFFQSVLEKDYTCTHSMQGGIIYQIFVDRFSKEGEVKVREPLVLRKDWGGKIQKNSTDPLVINREVFGGNFKGVLKKLDYLKGLGVTVLYFNPICMANSNHKYDTADYSLVDPMFGTNAEFKKLVDCAKQKGMKVIFDGVYNHTGSDSVYFNKNGRFDTLGAYKSKESKFYSWYNFEDYPNKYKSWWGIDTLPSIKHNSKDYQNYIAGDGGILEKFMKMGVSGVRLDVVDEITDEFVQKISKKVHEFGEDMIVMGEVWEDASTKISYSNRRKYFAENELNSVMNYPIKESILEYVKTGNANGFVSSIRMLQNNYPKIVMDNLMNFLGTHDTGRVFSDLLAVSDGDKKKAITLYKIATALLFTVPGVPSIFYGDEYGMENNDGSSRGCFDWNGYNNEIYDWFLRLTKIRKLEALKDAPINIIFSKNGKLVYERVGEFSRIIVCVNMGDAPLELRAVGNLKSFLSGKKKGLFALKKHEFEILIEENPNKNPDKN